jgi:L-amino acid N-acyltransferase YncA
VTDRLWAHSGIAIRPVEAGDVEAIAALDAGLTGVPKADYWQEKFARAQRRRRDNFFLVAAAECEPHVAGFVLGEIRAWEFGSPPCGWVFVIGVDTAQRLEGVGTALFDAICTAFRAAGVTKVRTMPARGDQLINSFFRSQGMMAGPFTELEKDLDE